MLKKTAAKSFIVVAIVMGTLGICIALVPHDAIPAPAVPVVSNLRMFDAPVTKYQRDTGRLPPTIYALWDAPSRDRGRWDGPYISEDVLLDPWCNDYRYSPRTNCAWSPGPDGLDGTPDDIARELSSRNTGGYDESVHSTKER